MPLPSSGAISFADVNVELGLVSTTSINLNQASVRTLFQVPSGQISMSNGYGKSNRVALSQTFATNSTNQTVNIATLPGYVAGSTDVTITVNAGVYVYSTATGTPGLTITGGAAGDTCVLINNGFILGMGGAGGKSYTSTNPEVGGAGGSAISLGRNVAITNNSYIAGGGGGGGGAYSGGGGGAGGGVGGTGNTNGNPLAGGAGGGPGAAGSNGAAGFESGPNYAAQFDSSGGGGRILPGTGGAGGARPPGSPRGGRGGGAGGGSGGFDLAEVGNQFGSIGAAGGGSNSVGGTPPTASDGLRYAGGGGGGWGAAGASGGANVSPVRAGGAGGRAIALNGFTATVTVTGTIYGAVS